MRTWAAVTLLAIVCATSCGRAPTILFKFPSGFNGLVLISEDRTSGVDIQVTNGVYTVEIPQGGKLRVKTLKPFSRWHKEVARYEDGNPIPDTTSTNNTGAAFFG